MQRIKLSYKAFKELVKHLKNIEFEKNCPAHYSLEKEVLSSDIKRYRWHFKDSSRGIEEEVRFEISHPENEEMIRIDGKKYSKDILKEAMQEYIR